MIVFCFDVPAVTSVCRVWACFCFEGSSVFPCGCDGLKPGGQTHRLGKLAGHWPPWAV